MSAAAANHATAAGVDAPTRSRVSWPAFRRALREAHESRLVHAVRIRPDGSLDVIFKHEKNSKEQQPSSKKNAPLPRSLSGLCDERATQGAAPPQHTSS